MSTTLKEEPDIWTVGFSEYSGESSTHLHSANRGNLAENDYNDGIPESNDANHQENQPISVIINERQMIKTEPNKFHHKNLKTIKRSNKLIEKKLGRRKSFSLVLKLWHFEETHIPPNRSNTLNIWAFWKKRTAQMASQSLISTSPFATEWLTPSNSVSQNGPLYTTASFYTFQDINFWILMADYFFIIRNSISILF